MSESTRGQINRKNIRLDIERNLVHYCPNTIIKMANLIAYDYNLSPSTLRYDYLPMWIDKEILISTKNGDYDVNPNPKTVTKKPSLEERKKQYEKFREEQEKVKANG